MIEKHRRPTTLRQMAPTLFYAACVLLALAALWWREPLLAVALPVAYAAALLLAGAAKCDPEWCSRGGVRPVADRDDARRLRVGAGIRHLGALSSMPTPGMPRARWRQSAAKAGSCLHSHQHVRNRRHRRSEGQRAPAVLQRMNDLLAHRGPDGEGFVFAAGGGSSCAIRFSGVPTMRLATCRSASASGTGASPSSTCRIAACSRWARTDGRTWIVFNGEIYNHQEIRS